MHGTVTLCDRHETEFPQRKCFLNLTPFESPFTIATQKNAWHFRQNSFYIYLEWKVYIIMINKTNMLAINRL